VGWRRAGGRQKERESEREGQQIRKKGREWRLILLGKKKKSVLDLGESNSRCTG